MGRRPPKNPDPPKTPEGDPPESDNPGGSVRKGRGGKKANPQKMETAAEALQMLAEAGAEPGSWNAAYNNAAKLYGADALNAALTAKGVDLTKWLPQPEAAAPPTNMVTSSDVTTGSVVPVTGSDGALPAVPTPEQAAALQALGLKGGNAPQAAAAGSPPPPPPPPPPNNPPNNPPKSPTIKEMIGMLMGKGAYTEPVEVPPVLSQVRSVDPAVAAAQPTVQLRTQNLQPQPATPAFKFPAGFDAGFDDGRVQLADADFSNVRSTVADPQTPVQWYARQGADASQTPQQLSGKKEPEAPDPFADIPVNPDKGLIKMRRNRANIANQTAPWAIGLGGLTGAGALIYALRGMMSGQPAQPQGQGPDPDEAMLMNAYQNGLR
jgi:hypothetical protein